MSTIEMSLSPRSINSVIKYLSHRYGKDMAQKAREFEQRLCERGELAARAAYGSESISYDIYKATGGTRLRANGPQVVFLEFGAGFLTDEGHDFAANAPVKVKPGSYSASHAKTFQHYVRDHATDDPEGMNYPYNRVPRRGLLMAYLEMKDHYYDVAKEVFR